MRRARSSVYRKQVAVLLLGLPASGCVGVQAGALYDYRLHKPEPLVGVFIEGFGDIDTREPTYGARAGALFPSLSRTNLSLQPEVNLPLGPERWNFTAAAGAAAGPWAVHTTACYRYLHVGSYGACGHWLSDGKLGLELNASIFAAAMFGGLGGIR